MLETVLQSVGSVRSGAVRRCSSDAPYGRTTNAEANTLISEIQFDLNSRDEIPKLLFGLQSIYSDDKLRKEVEAILKEIFPKNTKIGYQHKLGQ